MKVIFHEDFYPVYASDPAAAAGRMEAIVDVIRPHVEFILAEPATPEDIGAVHSQAHINDVERAGVKYVATLAAGGAIQAASLGLRAPSFALIRPPGHHASSTSAWGFCYFNNMAIALAHLKINHRIESAYVLDIDLHFGDGTVNILEKQDYVTVYNVSAGQREAYLEEVRMQLKSCEADIIGISAGFDNHEADWGGTLTTDDYQNIGRMVQDNTQRRGAGCFAVLEGGYNHEVLGQNVLALIRGLSTHEAHRNVT
jgi:acetoin utilization deacetylase AcuC-like enzyme